MMETITFILIAIVVIAAAILKFSSNFDTEDGLGGMSPQNPIGTKKKKGYYKYDKLLNTTEWKAKRLKILLRDGYRCRYCNSTNNLDIHHLYYNKYPNGKLVKPWDYPDSALITLCRTCHKMWHETHTAKCYYRKYSTIFNI